MDEGAKNTCWHVEWNTTNCLNLLFLRLGPFANSACLLSMIAYKPQTIRYASYYISYHREIFFVLLCTFFFHIVYDMLMYD